MVIMTIEVRMSARPIHPVSVVEAKARFSECVREAEAGGVVLIRRHGKAVAAVVPAADVERLQRLKAAGPEGGLASLAGGWPGSEELVQRIRELRRSRPRKAPQLR
jgi:prevent-host-death family protein